MDELDRLYRRLVQNIRGAAPELLARPFEVSQIYQELVPYRTFRRELAFDTNEDYELALMQLLAGLRGYLVVDAELQRAMRAELSSPNPDLAAFRVYATSAVSLATEPLRALEQQTIVAGRGPAPSGTGAAARVGMSEAAALAARATEAFEATPSTAHPPLAPPAPPAPPRPAPALEPMAPRVAPAQSVASDRGAGCRYCGGTLPDGRKVTFCPHCGHNLTVQHCPACATELEVEWKFCITCGRDVR